MTEEIQNETGPRKGGSYIRKGKGPAVLRQRTKSGNKVRAYRNTPQRPNVSAAVSAGRQGGTPATEKEK